jgi:hypothetical protein
MTWSYQFCTGVNGGSASCVSGAAYLIKATPLGADGVTQIGPIGIVYFDTIDREIARDTQGFDGSTIRVAKEYDTLGRVSRPSGRSSDVLRPPPAERHSDLRPVRISPIRHGRMLRC